MLNISIILDTTVHILLMNVYFLKYFFCLVTFLNLQCFSKTAYQLAQLEQKQIQALVD